MIRKKLALAMAVLATALAAGTAGATSAKWDSVVGPGTGTGVDTAHPWIGARAAGSFYAEWNVFDSSTTDSTPDVAGTGSVHELSATAFLTGGNIYSFAAPTSFSATLAGGGSGMFEVWLRIGTLGTTAKTTATLNGMAATRTETFTEPLGGFGGDEKEWYWTWTLPAASVYTFSFGASAASMSLDQVALYAAPIGSVPEPETYAVLLAGLGIVGLIARRRMSA